MGKKTIIIGANFFENAAERAGNWYLFCSSKLTTLSGNTAASWVYDGDARAAIRGNTINSVVINAYSAGTLKILLVDYADATTHITADSTVVATINVAPGFQIIKIPDVSVGATQSIGIEQSNGMRFYFGTTPGAAFSAYPRAEDSIQYDMTLNIGLGYIE